MNTSCGTQTEQWRGLHMTIIIFFTIHYYSMEHICWQDIATKEPNWEQSARSPTQGDPRGVTSTPPSLSSLFLCLPFSRETLEERKLVYITLQCATRMDIEKIRVIHQEHSMFAARVHSLFLELECFFSSISSRISFGISRVWPMRLILDTRYISSSLRCVLTL